MKCEKQEKQQNMIYSLLLNVGLCLCLLAMAIHYDTFHAILYKMGIGDGREMPVMEDAYWQMKTQGFENAEDKDGEVVFLGDSITDYTELSEMLDVSAPILNRGIGGDTTEGALERLYQITSLRPRKIFILLGINDIGDGMALSQSMERYGEILDSIRRDSPQTEVFAQSVLPVNHTLMPDNIRNRRRTTEAIVDYNQALKALASEKGVMFLDVFSQMADSGGEMPETLIYQDGVHLSRDGMETWIGCLRPYWEDAS